MYTLCGVVGCESHQRAVRTIAMVIEKHMLIFGVCEVFNWGILVWEILLVMQVEDPSTNPILASSAGCFIVASSGNAYVAQAVEALFLLQMPSELVIEGLYSLVMVVYFSF